MTPLDVRVLDREFPVGEALAAFSMVHSDAGGIATFLGKVRPDSNVQALELTHYDPLTLSGMQSLAETAQSRFDLVGAMVWHRIGMMTPGDPIVFVATASRHRRSAFGAADFLMDHLKSAVWFWKREMRNGSWHWIEPRPQDHADLERWK